MAEMSQAYIDERRKSDPDFGKTAGKLATGVDKGSRQGMPAQKTKAGESFEDYNVRLNAWRGNPNLSWEEGPAKPSSPSVVTKALDKVEKKSESKP
jgi:hypothetical protein